MSLKGPHHQPTKPPTAITTHCYRTIPTTQHLFVCCIPNISLPLQATIKLTRTERKRTTAMTLTVQCYLDCLLLNHSISAAPSTGVVTGIQLSLRCEEHQFHKVSSSDYNSALVAVSVVNMFEIETRVHRLKYT